MAWQGYKITSNILYQDNQSAILLETNGEKSSSKRTRALTSVTSSLQTKSVRELGD